MVEQGGNSRVILSLDYVEPAEDAFIEIAGERYRLLDPTDVIGISGVERIERLARRVHRARGSISEFELAKEICGLIAPDIPLDVIRQLKPIQQYRLAMTILDWTQHELNRRIAASQTVERSVSDA